MKSIKSGALTPLIVLCCSLISFPSYTKKYFSWNSEDKYLNETFFKNKSDGVFIEIGAHNGIDGSNSYFFEKELGWKGICVEPIPEVFSLLNTAPRSLNFFSSADKMKLRPLSISSRRSG